MTSSPYSGELRRAPPPPCGAIAPPRLALSSDRGDPSASLPFIAIASELRLVDLALEARSTLDGLAGASSRLSVLAVVPPLPYMLDGVLATPTSPPGVVLGRSAVSTVPLFVIAATGRWLHCHKRGCTDGVTAMVFFLASLQAHLWVLVFLPCLCALVLVAWPTSQACLPSIAAPCLSSWCYPRASMLATTYYCC
jgi:hypothetical protein